MKAEKWQKVASYQEKRTDQVVRCHLCPHRCVLQQGAAGICKTRVNQSGTLYTTAYGNPCSLSIDPIEKKPLFHFMPGQPVFSLATGGCNFRCLNCQNWQISQTSPLSLNSYDLDPEALVQRAIGCNTSMIAFTYTEPTVFYEYMYDTARIARGKGLKVIWISNGYINWEPLLDLCPYLDAANIDLKCFEDAMYRKLTGGRLQPVLDTLLTLKEKKIWLEITNLLIPGFSDNPEMITHMCEWLFANGFEDTPLHFSRFFPNYKLNDVPPTPAESLLEAKTIALKAGLKFVYIGNQPRLHGEDTVCPQCGHTLIQRYGYTVGTYEIQNGKCNRCGKSVPGIWQS